MALPIPSPTPTLTAPARLTARLLSLDVLRGLVVLLMLFVNEMAGVAGTPAFLLHVPAGVDGMTITDVVFPAFLFIAGMAVPLAMGARLRRGEPRATIWRHVLTRSASLIVMGVLMVNAEHGSALPPLANHLWNVLMTCALLMAWQTPAAGTDLRRHRTIVWAGVALLVVAALTYRGVGADGFVELRPQWWGILGLIGWAYLVCASLYLLTGDRVLPLLGAAAALYGLYFADNHLSWFDAIDFFDVGSILGSLAALVTSGAALTVLVRRRSAQAAAPRLRDALAFSAGMIAAGLLVHGFKDLGPAFSINKPLATPAWCLLSAGITGATWAALYYAADVRGWSRWPRAIVVAGENPLLVYLLAPLLSSLLALSVPLLGGVNVYAMLGRPFVLGLARSIVFAWAVARLCGWLRARGLRPRL